MDESEYFELPAEEIPEGKPTSFMVGELAICVIKLDGKYYAFSNVCSHIGGRMSDGSIVTNDRIVCPEHKAAFRISDGESLSFPRRGLMIYPAQVKEGKLFVSKSGCEKWREPLPH